MAQRLVRLLCDDCKQGFDTTSSEQVLLGLPEDAPASTVYRAEGCSHCHYTGYSGRTGIYELIEIDDELRLLIHEGSSEQQILEAARQRYPGIQEDGRRRILAGETSIEEVLRVTSVN